MEQYDYIFLGYPIWHGQAPRIISTFLESYDFSNVIIIPFCTSHSSDIGSSAENLHDLISDAAIWRDGRRFSGSATESDVAEWINSLDLPESEVSAVREFNFETKTVLLNNGYEMPIMGLGTYSLTNGECAVSIDALLKAGGRLIDTAYMYSNEAAVGQAVRNSDVPREEIHPYYQENDVIPYIQDLGIVVQGWYPLGGRGYTTELLEDEAITAIADAHGVSPAQVILRWNLQKGVVVIPGSSNPEHIRENLDLFEFELSDEEVEQINALDRNEKHDWY